MVDVNILWNWTQTHHCLRVLDEHYRDLCVFNYERDPNSFLGFIRVADDPKDGGQLQVMLWKTNLKDTCARFFSRSAFLLESRFDVTLKESFYDQVIQMRDEVLKRIQESPVRPAKKDVKEAYTLLRESVEGGVG